MSRSSYSAATVRRRRHAHPREGSGGVLPEVRGRAVKEGDQGHPAFGFYYYEISEY